MKLTGVVDMLRRKLLVVGVSAVVGVVLLLPVPSWLVVRAGAVDLFIGPAPPGRRL